MSQYTEERKKAYDPKTAPRDKWTLIYDSAQRGPRDYYLLSGRQAIELIDSFRNAEAANAALREKLAQAEQRAVRAEVQLAGCGVAAEGWGLSMDNGPAMKGDYGWSPAYESVMKLRYKSWRCFHCGFFTLDEKEAEAHFGERDDPEEFKPLCKWWQRMGMDERVQTLQDYIRDFTREQETVSDLEVALSAAEQEKAKLVEELAEVRERNQQLEEQNTQLRRRDDYVSGCLV